MCTKTLTEHPLCAKGPGWVLGSGMDKADNVPMQGASNAGTSVSKPGICPRWARCQKSSTWTPLTPGRLGPPNSFLYAPPRQRGLRTIWLHLHAKRPFLAASSPLLGCRRLDNMTSTVSSVRRPCGISRLHLRWGPDPGSNLASAIYFLEGFGQVHCSPL